MENNNYGDKEEQKKFIAWYQEFRNAYQDMHMEIRHLAIDDDEAIIWARITAKHAGRTTDVIRNVSPAGKKVSWQEVWYFDMQKTIFGKKWDIFVRGLDKMQSVQSYTVPEDYFDSINKCPRRTSLKSQTNAAKTFYPKTGIFIRWSIF